MKTIETYRAMRAAQRDNRLGDFAVLKAELVGATGARDEVVTALQAMDRTFPEVDEGALGQLPRGTLGREYVEFLERNELDPFKLSGAIDADTLRRNIFVARYGLLHDVFHVLVGFDTSWAGEAGVWAFVAAQRYARAHWIAVILACLVYPVLAPLSIPRIFRNVGAGIAMGRAAKTLITVPFETMWERPVAELRQELAIEPAHELDDVVVANLHAARV